MIVKIIIPEGLQRRVGQAGPDQGPCEVHQWRRQAGGV